MGDEEVYVLKEHEVFMRELISLYKQYPVLWDQKHPLYRNRNERVKAYEILVQKCQEYYTGADADFVKLKIDSMRCSFRKEHRKVLSSKDAAQTPDEVYRPQLWYYNLLLFTAKDSNDTAQEVLVETNENSGDDSNLSNNRFWNKEHTAVLIDLYKKQPCLYSPTHVYYGKKHRRKLGIKKLTENLMAATGKHFKILDVHRKLNLLRSQFSYEHKKVLHNRNKGQAEYIPTLWCYDSLTFLLQKYPDVPSNQANIISNRKRQRVSQNNKGTPSETDSDEDFSNIKEELGSSISSNNSISLASEVNVDIFDTIASNMAHKLREMTEEQRKIAEKIIQEVMYHGQMEQLTANSRFQLNEN